MKTFAQLKRDLQVGVKIKTIINNCKPELNGQVREIMLTQTNAIAFKRDDGRPSYLWWPKQASKYVEYEGDTFKIYDAPNNWNGNKRTLMFVYEIVK